MVPGYYFRRQFLRSVPRPSEGNPIDPGSCKGRKPRFLPAGAGSREISRSNSEGWTLRGRPQRGTRRRTTALGNAVPPVLRRMVEMNP